MEFGKYRLHEKIGQGGMAEVFRAQILGPEGFTRQVALKRVLSHLCEDPDFVKSFIDEARLGGLLSHHHIVQTLDFGNEDGIYYIAMEYVYGLTLREILNYHNRNQMAIPPAIALEIVLQLCEGLRYAHEAEDQDGKPLQMVHRDLKPTNIMINSHGVVKIADFGIARADTNSRRTSMGGILKGTAQYMSPEQAIGDLRLDRRSDIFSLGSIAYELVTLKPLFFDPNNSMKTLRNVQDAKVDPYLDEIARRWIHARPLVPVLARMLAKSPDGRPGNIAEIIPPIRQIQSTFSRLTDMQAWIQQVLVGMGKPLRSPKTGSLRVPGAGSSSKVATSPEANRVSLSPSRDLQTPSRGPGSSPGIKVPLHSSDSMPGYPRSPAPGPEPQHEMTPRRTQPRSGTDPQGRAPRGGGPNSAPSVATLPPANEEKTPLAHLRRIPGQPSIREDLRGRPDQRGDVPGPVQQEGSRQGIQAPLESATEFSLPDPMQANERTNRSNLEGVVPDDGYEESLQEIPTDHDAPANPTLTNTVPGGHREGTDGKETRRRGPPPGSIMDIDTDDRSIESSPSDVALLGAQPSLNAPRGSTPAAQECEAPIVPLLALSHPYESSLRPPGSGEADTPAGVGAEWSQPGPGGVDASSSEEHSSSGRTLATPKPASAGRLFAVGLGTALLAVVIVVGVGLILDGSGPFGNIKDKKYRIETIPPGAEVVFKDPNLPSGRTPLDVSLESTSSCLEATVERPGYRTKETCLRPWADPDPVWLEAAPDARTVLFLYPNELRETSISIGGWKWSRLRRENPPSAKQSLVRLFTPKTEQRVEVSAQGCNTLSKTVDFGREDERERFRRIKIVLEGLDPCLISFDDPQP